MAIVDLVRILMDEATYQHKRFGGSKKLRRGLVSVILRIQKNPDDVFMGYDFMKEEFFGVPDRVCCQCPRLSKQLLTLERDEA